MFASLQPKRAQTTAGTHGLHQNSKSATNKSTSESSSSPLSYGQRRRQSTEEARHTDTDTDANTTRDVAAEDEEQRSGVSQDSSSSA